MAKAPAFQFYPSDFLTGTAMFKPEERGAYITLLCIQWEHGGIKEEDLEFLSGLPKEKLGRVMDKFVKGDDGVYRNARLEQTRDRQKTFFEKQVINGKKGGRPKKENPSLSSGLTQTITQKKPNRRLKNEDEEEEEREGVEDERKIPPSRFIAQQQFSINRPPHWSTQYMEGEVDAWFDYYQTNGWHVGKNKMKDWKAAIRTWIRNDYNFKKHTNGKQQTLQQDAADLDRKIAERYGPNKNGFNNH